MKPITFPKSDQLGYEGRYGWGYCCGVAVLNRFSDKVLRIEPINSLGRIGPCSIDIPMDKAQELADLLVSTAGVSPNGVLSVKDLMDKYGAWGEHPTYGREDWGAETALRNTQRGYWDWVQARLEQNIEETKDALLSSPNSLG